MSRDLILCVDIGGTHITTAFLDGSEMKMLERSLIHQAVHSQAEKQEILQEWDSAIARSMQCGTECVQAMFISIPGPFDYQKGICLMDGMHKYQSLLNMDVKSYFATKYGVALESIYFFNDALAFLLGEIYHHRWSDKRVVGLTLGTGLGSALYTEGETVDLNFGSSPFREGIVEDYISTRGLISCLNAHGKHGFKNVKSVVEAKDAFQERKIMFEFLSLGLHDFIHSYIIPLEPDVIVLGGSIAKAHSFFLYDLQEKSPVPIVVASMDELNLFYGMASTRKRFDTL